MFNSRDTSRFIRAAIALLAGVYLLSASAFGQGDENAPAPSPVTGQNGVNTPSLEQTLVPEGVFAMKLAEVLKLGIAPDDAKAESLLSDVGIEPKSGWITDYPVTPAVIGEIETGITTAADQGKLAMGKDQALKALGEVKTQLGLEVSPGTSPPQGSPPTSGNTTIYAYTDSNGVVHYTDQYDSVPSEYRANARIIRQGSPHEPSGGAEPPGPQYVVNPNPEVVNNYYYEEGPPVVTYYLPPDPYYYLYSWVPYPFWSTGFYFPGFYILNDFHRRVFFHRHPYFVSHHVGNGGFRGPSGLGPITKGFPVNPPPHPTSTPHWFASPRTQTGARAIVTLNQNRPNSISAAIARRPDAQTVRPPQNGWAGPTRNVPAVINRPALRPNGHFRAPSNVGYGGRTLNQPAFNQRQLAPSPPRVFYPPVHTPGRNFGPSHTFNGGSFGGFHGSNGSSGGFDGRGVIGGFQGGGGGGFGGHGGFGGARR